MENTMMKAVKNMALGAVAGAAAVMAGAVYMNENKSVQKTVKTFLMPLKEQSARKHAVHL